VSTLVVGDVHGCAAELGRLLALARAEGVARVVCVGDLFTKGPDPAGVWRHLVAAGATAVLGNHDQRLLDVLDGRRPRDEAGRACAAALDAADPGWRATVRGWPLFAEVEGWTVVHAGLHPSGDRSRTTAAMALAMRRFPEDDPEALPWHAQYEGAAPVVFGHDARGGLVWRARDGRPHVVGLDTGCVYGGALTGLVLPEAVLLRVAAERAHAPVGGAG
jgi:hypothetical protein